MTMRNGPKVAVLFAMMLAVMSCSSSTSGRYQPGEVSDEEDLASFMDSSAGQQGMILTSLMLPESPQWTEEEVFWVTQQSGLASIVFFAEEYDPQTRRLVPEGEIYKFFRVTADPDNCLECRPDVPSFAHYTVKPGHYVITEMTFGIVGPREQVLNYTLNLLVDDGHDKEEVDVVSQGVGPRFEVGPGEIVNIGAVMLPFNRAGIRVIPYEEEAQARLDEVGINQTMITRPVELSPAGDLLRCLGVNTFYIRCYVAEPS